MTAANPIWLASYAPGVPAHLRYGDTTLVDQLERSAREHADWPALDFFGRTTTYAELSGRVERVAEGLRKLGVQAGDSVAVVMPNCPQNVIATYAVMRLGAAVAQHNPLYTASELRHPFADHGARVAIVWDKVAPRIAELKSATALEQVVAVDLTAELPLAKRLALHLPLAKARAARRELTAPAPGTVPWATLEAAPRLSPDHARPQAGDVALLLYTSGTTGVPKGVPLTHHNLVANCTQGQAWVPAPPADEQDISLVVLPLFHAYGATIGVFYGVATAAKLVLLPKPDIGLIMDAIKRAMPTFIPAVPPIYAHILDEAERRGVSIRGVRSSISGAMPLPPALVERWEAATGGLLVEGYGLTETSPVITANPMSAAHRPGSIGVPFPDVEVRVVDKDDPGRDVPLGEPGELLVRGPQVFGGYRNLPDETASAFADGWFRTGDIVTMAPDGFLTVVDRIKEIIITGGFNVYPSEVEAVLREHPTVLDVAVVGLPGEAGSELVVAAIVLGAGHELDPASLRAHAKDGLAAYKVPREFFVIAELPTNALGKVLRREVAAHLREG